MNRKQAFRMALETDKSKKERGQVKVKSRSGHLKDQSAHSVNSISDAMVTAIDNRETLGRHERHIQRLQKTGDVHAFFQDIAPSLALEMMMIATNSESEKLKVEALRDLMDRAGYGKVTKHAVARFDASESKDAIISSILGAKKDLGKMGIEIVDEDNEETTGEPSEG